MVSTIVDGIDNGTVKDVFVYRASYSLFRLIQSLGRIHPARQNHDYARPYSCFGRVQFTCC